LGVIPPYTEFAERWGNPGFTDYVKLLEQQADKVLQSSIRKCAAASRSSFFKYCQIRERFLANGF
jgi:thiaminase/transcriptional activator TenA